jgi:hypothetical protein
LEAAALAACALLLGCWFNAVCSILLLLLLLLLLLRLLRLLLLLAKGRVQQGDRPGLELLQRPAQHSTSCIVRDERHNP